MEFLIVVIILALVFDFLNGFHDAANSIATVVSTKVLSPFFAVIWAAFFNFIAFLIFDVHIAKVVGKGIVHADIVTLPMIASGLIAAIIWNLLTWWLGIPSSSSHTLVGGFAGAAIVKGGFAAVIMSGIMKIVLFIFLSPIIGLVLSFFLSKLLLNICKNFSPRKVDRHFRRLQLISAALYSLGHGGNDAQKVMGIIYVALISMTSITGITENSQIPLWVVLSCQGAIAFGTMFGGWRIVKTMGQKITKLKPFEGFSAETAGAATLFGTAALGIPVSTTHTITGAIIGVGITKRVSAVHWGVTINIVWAWILTIPVSALLAALIMVIMERFTG